MAKKSKNEKGAKDAAQVVATLQRQQANALVAYLNYKKYHWLSYGPLFRDIHLLLDEQATRPTISRPRASSPRRASSRSTR
jgi:DNA-binding ferritin-like protein